GIPVVRHPRVARSVPGPTSSTGSRLKQVALGSRGSRPSQPRRRRRGAGALAAAGGPVGGASPRLRGRSAPQNNREEASFVYQRLDEDFAMANAETVY